MCNGYTFTAHSHRFTSGGLLSKVNWQIMWSFTSEYIQWVDWLKKNDILTSRLRAVKLLAIEYSSDSFYSRKLAPLSLSLFSSELALPSYYLNYTVVRWLIYDGATNFPTLSRSIPLPFLPLPSCKLFFESFPLAHL